MSYHTKRIKEILVNMAIEATLPSDMNELDDHVFDCVLDNTIIPGSLKDPYVSLDVPLRWTNSIGKLRIQVKLEDEGVVVDVFRDDNPDPVASTWKTYQMMKDGEE